MTTDAGYEFPSGCLFSSFPSLHCPFHSVDDPLFPLNIPFYFYIICVCVAYVDSAYLPLPCSSSLFPLVFKPLLWYFLMVFYLLGLSQSHSPCLFSGKWFLRYNHHLVLEVPFTNEEPGAQNWSRAHMPGPARRGTPWFHPCNWPLGHLTVTMSLL